MIWLNNTFFACYDQTNDEISEETEIISSELSLLPELLNDSFPNIFMEFSTIFSELLNNKITSSEACFKYSDVFRAFGENEAAEFYNVCFRILGLFLDQNEKDIRTKIIEAGINLPEPKDNKSLLLYYLCFNKKNYFLQIYKDFGGTEIAADKFFEIHLTKKVGRWLQNMLQLQEDRRVSKFDKELIDELLEDVINCDNDFLTMAVTLFLHHDVVTLDDIYQHYESENDKLQKVDEDYFNFFKALFGFLNNKTTDKTDFFKKIYRFQKNSFISFHFIYIICCYINDSKSSDNNTNQKKEFQLALLRCVETLASLDFFYDADDEEKNEYLNKLSLYFNLIEYPEILLKNEFAFKSIYSLDIQNKIDHLTNFTIKLQNKLRTEFNEHIRNIQENYSISQVLECSELCNFLNDNFYQCDDDLKHDIVSTILEPLPDSNDSILKGAIDIDESVILSMIEFYLDRNSSMEDDKIKKIRLELEQHIFNYISSHGDLPEYHFLE